jgi:hypothetical protein
VNDDFSGKVVIITGASSGIGEATAKLVASKGAKIILGARREDKLQQIGDQIEKDGGEAALRGIWSAVGSMSMCVALLIASEFMRSTRDRRHGRPGDTLTLLVVGHHLWAAAVTLFMWGLLNSALPVVWSTWLTKGIADEPEAGGGLMVAAIQLAIMLGAAFGGLLLDRASISATWVGGAALLALASLAAGSGSRLRPAE